MTIAPVEKKALTLGDIGGVHHEIDHLPLSILDGLGDHEGDLEAAGTVAQQVYENWPDDEWRNAFLMALRQHIENQASYHKAELIGLYNAALKTVRTDGRRAIVKAYLHDALNEMVSKANEWEERLHPRGQGGQFTYSNREQQASLAAAMLHHQGGFYGGDQVWNFQVRRGSGKVENVEMSGGTLPKMRRGDRVLRVHQVSGVHAPTTDPGDAMNFAEALGANSAQAGAAGAVVHEMSRQGKIQYGPDSWFTRLESASETLHHATQGRGGVRVRTAIAMGKYVGKHGPEVSRVLGPHMRRFRYKYKGTEADPSQWTQVARSGRQSTTKGEPEDIPAFREKLTRSLATEKGKSGLDGLAAVPTASQAKIMLKTGSTAPSHGYILNAQGKVTSQAHGYGDDHYVPFNLRKIHALNGGSYVRSRAYGGPTTEDIALANMTGATGFNVISRSGIYRVNFTPRTNKAGRKIGAWAKNTAGDANGRMVDRYGRLLDAIKSGKITDPETNLPTTLNGRGYELALHSLAKQFPYFIKNVEFVPASKVEELKGLRASEGDTDSGYIRPYYLKPSEAVQGYYDDLLGGHGSFDELDSHRLGRARMWAAEDARRRSDAARRLEAERAARIATPLRREGQAPTNLSPANQAIWGATGGGQGVGTRPQAEVERNMNVLSPEDFAAYTRWAKAVLDHADTGVHPGAAKAKRLLNDINHAEPGSDRHKESTDYLDALKRDPDERVQLEDLLNEVAPQSGTGLEAFEARPILRSQGETEESVHGLSGPHAGYVEDIEADDEFKAPWGFKQYMKHRNWRNNANLGADKQAVVDYFKRPREDDDWNGMSPEDFWEATDPDGEFDGLPYWKWYQNQYAEAQHLDQHGSIEGFNLPHKPPDDAPVAPAVGREFRGAPQAGEADMDEAARRREEASPERQQDAEREADDWMRRNFPEEPPF